MSGKSSDGQIDQLVKARWLALGLSQNDLAEVLGAPEHLLREVDDIGTVTLSGDTIAA